MRLDYTSDAPNIQTLRHRRPMLDFDGAPQMQGRGLAVE